MRRVACVLAAMWLLGGCSSTVRLMPTPTLFTNGDPALFQAGAESPADTTIEVLYATNRMPTGPQNARHYTRIRSNQLRVGVATLQVGDGTLSWEALQAMSTSVAEGRRPTITLKATREMAVLNDDAEAPRPDAEAFFAQVDALLQRIGNRDVLVYVHGANTDFDRAAAQAAQFQHFLGRDTVVVVFSWPSAGTMLRYGRDVATARRTVPSFARLLELLSTHTRAAHLNVLAYSAGAMIASPGLARAAGDQAGTGPGQLRLGEIYYAAPDIDFPLFVDNLPRYEDHVRRVTVSVNMGDRALSFAQWIHRVSRAGRPNMADLGPEEANWLVAATGREELDVLAIKPEDLPGLPASSHSFWYDHPWVSSDILLKLRFHAPPPARGLSPNSTEIKLAFWTFPTDYAERLPSVVQALTQVESP
ncbi:MAG: alpha/beta hydrolase [Gammaproteobacteria bacterium]|nr:alpha/beta hydrolase [Gammaproteobacteria bacterium]